MMFWGVSVSAQNTPVNFSNQTNLLTTSNNSGVAMGVVDLNGDGKDDILRYNQANFLQVEYQNNPNQTFGHANVGSVSGGLEWSTCVADVDHNGFNDILVGGAYDNLKLLYNNGGGNNYNTQIIPSSNIFVQGSNFADIDNDGWADIFACHDDAESRKYRNNQNGTFTFTPSMINTTTVPFSDNSGNYASMWTDYDNDDDLDLYISKCRSGANNPNDPRRINMLFQNDGNNNFTEVADQAGLKIGAQSWVADFADIDNDGDLDVFVANHFDDCQLLVNNGNGTFTDVTASSGFLPALAADNVFAIQSIFRDFNNDGFVDLIFSGTQHHLFYNDGDGTFTQAPNPFGNNQIESLAIGDLNHDGFLDVYAGYAELFTTPSNIADRLYLNNGNQNNFFSVQLEGTQSNINGIGARVEIYGAWGKQIREVRSGEGYGIMNSFTQHFGLGSATQIDKVVVRWPSGIIQEIDNPAANQFLQIVEEIDVNCEGMACDDNDPQTINDMLDVNCGCVGTACFNMACDDNDPQTINDVLDANCNCAGTPTNVGNTLSLQVKTYLQGALINSPVNNEMRHDLQQQSMIPLSEPYSTLPNLTHYGNGGGETTTNAVLNNSDVVDWLMLELRDANDPSQIVATQAVLLRKDGIVIDAQGGANIQFTGMNDTDYYVALRHRNHLGAMTAQPQSLSSTPYIDFSSQSTNLWGTDAMVIMDSGNRGLWAGNCNTDATIIFQGNNTDTNDPFFTVLQDGGNTSGTNFISQGYSTSDVNLDGNIIYQGFENDPNYIFFNIFSVPDNGSLLTNYILEEQLP